MLKKLILGLLTIILLVSGCAQRTPFEAPTPGYTPTSASTPPLTTALPPSPTPNPGSTTTSTLVRDPEPPPNPTPTLTTPPPLPTYVPTPTSNPEPTPSPKPTPITTPTPTLTPIPTASPAPTPVPTPEPVPTPTPTPTPNERLSLDLYTPKGGQGSVITGGTFGQGEAVRLIVQLNISSPTTVEEASQFFRTQVEFEVTAPDGSKLVSRAEQADLQGKSMIAFMMPDNAQAGQYNASAVYSDKGNTLADHVAFVVDSSAPAAKISRSGRIDKNETWSGTVHITGDLKIEDWVSVTIEPGTTVFFAAHRDDQHTGQGEKTEGHTLHDPTYTAEYAQTHVAIWGPIVAKGTNDSVIVFTSDSLVPSYADWHYINLYRGSILDYTVVEYGQVLAVEPHSGDSILISNSTVRHILSAGIGVNAPATITANLVYDCGHEGIDVSPGSGTPIISRNTVFHSAVGIFAHADQVIENNFLIDNDRGLCLFEGGGIFRNNMVTSPRGAPHDWTYAEFAYEAFVPHGQRENTRGLGLGNSSADISGNTILGHPVNIELFGICSLTISDNIIVDGGKGISLGEVTGYVLVQGNNICAHSDFDMGLNNTTLPVNATNNWWGTPDRDLIQKKIWDYQDDTSLGNVSYEPYEAQAIVLPNAAVTDTGALLEEAGQWSVKPFWPGSEEKDSDAPAPSGASAIRGNQPSDVVMTPDGSRVYATAMGTHNVFVIDTKANEITDVIDLWADGFNGAWPFRAAITPDGKKIYVANMFSRNISVISTETNRVAASIDMQHPVHDVVFTPDGQFAYIDLMWDRIPVVEVSTNRVLTTISMDGNGQTYALAASHDGRRVYVVSQLYAGGAGIQVIDVASNKVVDHYSLPVEVTNQGEITLSLDDSVLYLPCGATTTTYERPTEGVNKVFVVDLAGRSLVSEIAVVGGPTTMRLSPDGQLGYVPGPNSGDIFVADITTNAVVGSIEWNGVFAGEEWRRLDLRDMVITPDGKRLFLTGWDGDAIIVADLVDRKVINVIELNVIQAQLYEIAMTPDGKRIYVSSQAAKAGARSSLLVIDTATNSVIDEIVRDGGYPSNPYVTYDGRFVYAVSGDRVLVIETATHKVIREIPLGDAGKGFYDIAVLPDQGKAYVTAVRDRYLYVVDLISGEVVKRLSVGWWPQMVVATHSGDRIYVSRQNNPYDAGGLVAIDTSVDEVISVVSPPVGTGAYGRFDLLVTSPDDAFIYWATGPQSVNVIEIATNKVLRSIDVSTQVEREFCNPRGIHPSDIAFTADGLRAYIPCGDGYYIAVIDVAQGIVLDHIIDVGIEPVAIVITPDDRFAYVTNKESESVSVIDLATNRVIASISTAD